MPLTRAAAKVVQDQLATLSNSAEHGEPSTSGTYHQTGNLSSLGDSGINPLMNDLVLRTLFEYVRPKDLLPCRLVCKNWNKETLPFVKKEFIVTINCLEIPSSENRSVDEIYCRLKILRSQGLRERRSWAMDNFFKLINSNTSGIPFTKYNWKSFNTLEKSRQMFLQQFGSTVKELRIESCKSEHVSKILEMVPNLECLRLPVNIEFPFDFRSEVRGEPPKPCILFPGETPKLPRLKILHISDHPSLGSAKYLGEILRVAKNISNIYITAGTFTVKNNILVILKFIEVAGKDSCIKSLSFQKITEPELEQLKKMIEKDKGGLKLEILKVAYAFKDFQELPRNSAWFRLVELCKNDIIELTITETDTSEYDDDEMERAWILNPRQIVKFPTMSKLKILELNLPVNKQLHTQSNNFKTDFPLLEKLTVSNYIHNLHELLLGYESCPNIKSLIVKENILSTVTFDRIIFMFPALKTFRSCISARGKRTMQKLWNAMTQLEELGFIVNTCRTFDVDSLMTGIPKSKCQEIKRDAKYWNSLKEMTGEEKRRKILELTDNLRTSASIANLTNLRRITFSCVMENIRERLSDVTGYLGFYSLKKLKHINIQECVLSKNCCESMVDEMGLVSWTFSASNDPNIIPNKPYPYEES